MILRQRLAELREKAISDEISNINGARAEGEQIGEERGMQKVALKMLDTGSSIEYVAEVTGLSIQELSKLRN